MKSFANKKKKEIIFLSILILVIALIGIGSTFAISNYYSSPVDIKTLDMAVNYAEVKFSTSELIPINEKKINIDTKDNVIKVEFNIKGNKDYDITNVIYDVSLKDLNIDCELLSDNVKWNLYKNSELLSTGTFSPNFDSSVLNNKLFLTNKQQKLLNYNTSGDNYILIIWLNDPCENLSNCSEYINQNNMLNKQISGTVAVNLYTTKKDVDSLENRYRTIESNYKCS